MAITTTAISVGYGIYSSNRAENQARRNLQQQRQIDIGLAESGLANAQFAAGHSYEYAEKVLEIAGKQLELDRNTAAFTAIQGEYAEQRGATLEQVYDAQARTAEAIGQRAAIAEDTQTKRLASAGEALTGAGGMVSEDTSRIIAEVEADGQYNALVRLWEGDDRAAGLEYEGDIAAHEGTVARIVGDYNSAVQLVEADIRYENAGLVAENTIHNAEQGVLNAQSQLDALRGGGGSSNFRNPAGGRRSGVGGGGT